MVGQVADVIGTKELLRRVVRLRPPAEMSLEAAKKAAGYEAPADNGPCVYSPVFTTPSARLCCACMPACAVPAVLTRA